MFVGYIRSPPGSTTSLGRCANKRSPIMRQYNLTFQFLGQKALDTYSLTLKRPQQKTSYHEADLSVAFVYSFSWQKELDTNNPILII